MARESLTKSVMAALPDFSPIQGRTPVLPALVDRLKTVTVGIENVRSVITGIVIQARAGLAVVGRARRHSSPVEHLHPGLALGDKSDMPSPCVRLALPEPEEYTSVTSQCP